MKSLISHLLGDTRTAILAALLLRPDEPQHVRELARLTGVSPGTLHRELTALTSLGVLRRNAVGRQVYFTANCACPVFEELAGLVRKTAGMARTMRDTRAAAARPALHSPAASYGPKPASKETKSVAQKLRIAPTKLEALCRKYGIAKLSLFGSASRNELTPESDVDLMVEFSPDSRASLFDIAVMQEEFSAALGGRKVDIATPEILRNPFRRGSIVRDLKSIYEA